MIVMRADGVLRVILNVRVVPQMPCKQRDDKYIEIIASEKPGIFTKFLLRLGSKDGASQLYASIMKILDKVNKGPIDKGDAAKETESPKKIDKTEAILDSKK